MVAIVNEAASPHSSKCSHFLHFLILSFIPVLMSCQSSDTLNQNTFDGSLASDNGQLDLSLSTLEQQSVDKALAKQSLAEARQKRMIVEPETSEKLHKVSKINIALYARQTNNTVGTKTYNRVQIKKRKLDPCSRFASSNEAQRFFLEKNGPKNDFWNLDPDGDGFACDWDPEPFKKLEINKNVN